MLATQIQYYLLTGGVYFYLLVKIQASYSHTTGSKVKFVSQQMKLCIFRAQVFCLAHFLIIGGR